MTKLVEFNCVGSSNMALPTVSALEATFKVETAEALDWFSKRRRLVCTAEDFACFLIARYAEIKNADRGVGLTNKIVGMNPILVKEVHPLTVNLIKRSNAF